MSLSAPRHFFGVHSFTPYNRADGTFYGAAKVLASSSLSFQGSLVSLKGGSAKVPWAVEEGEINSQLTLKMSEYPDWLFELMGGALSTPNTTDATGAVTTLTNIKGTSVMNASTGIASVSVLTGSEADLKFGKYIVKAISATTVMVYAASDVDFGSGTAKTFAADDLSVAAAALTITASSDTNVSGFGVKLSGGSGVIALVAGDTASFEVRPANVGVLTMTLGAAASVFPEFGAIIYGKKRGNGELVEIDVPKMKGEGVPLGFEMNKFSEADIKCQIMYDSTLDYMLRMRQLQRKTVI